MIQVGQSNHKKQNIYVIPQNDKKTAATDKTVTKGKYVF